MSFNVREQAATAFKNLKEIILYDSLLANSVWESELKSGKALEIVSLLALIEELQKCDGSVELVEKLAVNPGLFYARNEIPLHHGAQAGHEANLASELTLEERFLASFTPKATFRSNDGSSWMVFREGNPLHLLHTLVSEGDVYRDRCDLVLVRGSIKDVAVKGKVISFTHNDNGEHATYKMTIKNSPIIPLRDYSFSPNYFVKTSGIIECSVSKSKEHVDSQLSRYHELFQVDETDCPSLFIHGREGKSKFDTINIDLSNMVDSFLDGDNRLLLTKFLNDCLH
jgi:hypothetical protein